MKPLDLITNTLRIKKQRIILVLCLVVSTSVTIAQEATTLKKHEFRIDAAEGIIVPAIDIGYEYLIDKNSGFGVSAYYNLDDNPSDDFQVWAVTPFYRQYFFSKEDYGAKGFFVEGSLRLAAGDELNFNTTSNTVQEDAWTKFGVGFAIGKKWVSKNGFVAELSVGGGRFFGDDDQGPGGFFRGGISVGYRF